MNRLRQALEEVHDCLIHIRMGTDTTLLDTQHFIQKTLGDDFADDDWLYNGEGAQ